MVAGDTRDYIKPSYSVYRQMDVLKQLTRKQRDIVERIYVDGMTQRQAASYSGRSERAVRYLIHGARRRLARTNVRLPRPTHGRHRQTAMSAVGDEPGMDPDNV